jgi:DNA-binding SARP family transcriptional activator
MLQVLGGFTLRSTDGRDVELPTRKAALLLAYLAVPAGSGHSRDRLADLLWPSSGQEQARGSLRHALAALRKVLGADAIDGTRDQIRLRPGIVAVDLDAIADVAEGRTLPDLSGSASTATFLDGVTADGEALSEWLTFERTRSRALQQAALQKTIDALAQDNRHAAAIDAAERLVALDPLREHSHRVLMRAFVQAGERSKALAQFQRLQHLLKSELGVAPSPQSAELADEVRRDAAPDRASYTRARDRSGDGSTGADRETAPRRISIAVLPFQCLGEDNGLAAFADGFSSELVAGLSRSPEFSVIAWQSSAQLSGRTGDAARSAAELEVDYALTGSLRFVDDRLRIAAQLVAARSRTWTWAERYELDKALALSSQDSIIAGIMGAIDAGVRNAEREAARAKPIADLDDWSLYHRGMWHVYRFTREDVTAAEQLFSTAIQREPSSAGPHAGLAYACLVRVLWRFTDDLRGALGEGLRHARNAVTRDEHDAHAHTVLGRLLVMSGQLERGIEHLERAIELNPSHAHAYYGLGHALYVAGRPDEALEPLDTALRLSPKDPLASMFLTMASFCHLMRDDLPAAEATARRARNLLSKETWSRLALAATLQIRGDLDGASSAVAEAREIEPGLNMSTFAPLVQHIPTEMRDRVLAALAQAGLPGD